MRRVDESTETAPAVVGVTRSGTGSGKTVSNSDWESRKSRVPKHDEFEVLAEARTADIRGDKTEREGAAAVTASVERTTRF